MPRWPVAGPSGYWLLVSKTATKVCKTEKKLQTRNANSQPSSYTTATLTPAPRTSNQLKLAKIYFLDVHLWPAGIEIAYTTSNLRKNGRKTIFGEARKREKWYGLLQVYKDRQAVQSWPEHPSHYEPNWLRGPKARWLERTVTNLEGRKEYDGMTDVTGYGRVEHVIMGNGKVEMKKYK